ncbi:MAG: glycosyltransferase family 4 protein [Verrucomicrobia bacterium]|nr:glycosyltransferase family 4 protein [Verrucomicrobiota bacterium]
MKILHVNHRDLRHPRAGGLETVIHELSRRWAQQGHEVAIACAGYAGCAHAETVEGIRVFRIGREEFFNFIAGPWLRRRDWLGADVVIEHLSKVACFTPLFAGHRPCAAHVPHLFGRAIFEEVSWPIGVYVYVMERLIPCVYKRTPIWALCQSTADELAGLGIPAANIRVISGGVDTGFYAGDAQPASHPTALYVGRIRRYKGLAEPLLTAWRIVINRCPDARLQIVGKGDYQDALRKEIAMRGLEASVELTGYVDEAHKRELMRSAWLMVYPSVKEGWGLSVIEAGAMGTPTVASDSPGLREAIRNGETGLLVPHGDANALAQAILRLIEDQSLRARLGGAARMWSRNFDWDEMAKRVLDFLASIIEKGKCVSRA